MLFFSFFLVIDYFQIVIHPFFSPSFISLNWNYHSTHFPHLSHSINYCYRYPHEILLSLSLIFSILLFSWVSINAHLQFYLFLKLEMIIFVIVLPLTFLNYLDYAPTLHKLSSFTSTDVFLLIGVMFYYRPSLLDSFI